MKSTCKGLTLSILKKSIKVMDKSGSFIYRHEFKFDDTRESKMQALRDAKSWLWNMGNFNGEGNEMMQRCNYSWVKALGLFE